jgi:putative nucleotidyltransferase with HDIG domain
MDPVQLGILVAVSALDVGLGVVVLQRNNRRKSHILFAAAAFSLVAWLVTNFMCDQPAFYSNALYLNRLSTAVGIAMGMPLIAFAVLFPRDLPRLPVVWMALLTPLGVFAVAAARTPALIAAVEIEDWGTNVIQGQLFSPLVAYGVFLLACLAVSSLRSYRRAEPRQRAQFKYLYLGLGLFFSAVMVVSAALPLVTGSNEFASLLPLTTLLFLVPTAYAIVRHQLLDVEFVVLRGVMYSLLLVLAGVGFMLLVEAARNEFAVRLGIDPNALMFVTGLAAIFSFQVAREWLERVTDRYFFRRTYDPGKLLSVLGAKMASTIDEARLAEALANDLGSQMRLEFAAVAFRQCDAAEVVSSGRSLDPDLLLDVAARMEPEGILVADAIDRRNVDVGSLVDQGVRVLVPLSSEGVLLGALALGPKRAGTMYSERDTGFLGILASEASIAMKNAHLFAEKNQRVRELTALNELAFALGSSRELDSLLCGALEQVVSVTAADTGSILLLDGDDEFLRIAAAVGIPETIVETTRIPVGEGIAGWVAECKEPLVLVDDDDPRFAGELLRQEIKSAICAPVLSKDEVIGVLNVSRKDSSELFTTENMHVVTSFAGQLGIAIENARLYTNLESTFLGTISALAAAVDAKDPYTFGHSSEVTIHAVKISEELGLDADDVQMIRIAATLHDIGKIGIDGAILLKPGKLTDEEREIINRHPAIGADILAPLDFLREAVPLVLFHHERYGGGGYPSGISGEAIPFGARIISVADSFNAMVSDRPYREGLSLEAAMRELRENSGSQFDPVCVDAFLKLLNEGAIARRPELPVAPSPGWQFDKPPLQS